MEVITVQVIALFLASTVSAAPTVNSTTTVDKLGAIYTYEVTGFTTKNESLFGLNVVISPKAMAEAVSFPTGWILDYHPQDSTIIFTSPDGKFDCKQSKACKFSFRSKVSPAPTQCGLLVKNSDSPSTVMGTQSACQGPL